MPELSLRSKRILFTWGLARLIVWIEEQGWLVAIDEAKVKSPRNVRIGDTVQLAKDAEHGHRGTRHSFHNDGLAADLLLYDDLDGDGEQDDYVSNGDDPRWKAIARKWESLHPLYVSGRRWHDANHISLGEGDKTEPLP